MLNVNELRNGAVFKEDKDLFQVVNFEHIKMGRGSGNVKIKAKNLKTGSIIEKSYITGARVEEADIEKKKTQYLYADGDSLYFMDPVSFEQFSLPLSVASDSAKFLKESLEVVLIVGENEALSMEIPNNLIYEIVETGPGERGNTVSNVYKDAKADNGLLVKVPMFMKVGDKVKIDTRNGQYVERVK